MRNMDEAVVTEREPRADPLWVGPSLDFEGFFEAHHQRLFRALWLMTRNRDEAEEVVQDAFLRVWQRWDRVGNGSDPAGYLYRTAMNLWRSRLRRAAVAMRNVVHQIQREDEMAAVDQQDAVIRALAPLPQRQRAAVILLDVLDLSSERAGAALGIEPVTVRVLAARARATLAKEIGDRDE
jgi:RNA polymerase sigma-70 factor (ECF subfamily)